MLPLAGSKREHGVCTAVPSRRISVQRLRLGGELSIRCGTVPLRFGFRGYAWAGCDRHACAECIAGCLSAAATWGMPGHAVPRETRLIARQTAICTRMNATRMKTCHTRRRQVCAALSMTQRNTASWGGKCSATERLCVSCFEEQVLLRRPTLRPLRECVVVMLRLLHLLPALLTPGPHP